MKSIFLSLSYYNFKGLELEIESHAGWAHYWDTRTYLFLESERNASDGSLLDSLHQVGGEASDLVSKSLCLDHGDVVDDSLIYMEVVGQPTPDKHALRKVRGRTAAATRWARSATVPLTFRSTFQ
jgi:hypothetical protein